MNIFIFLLLGIIQGLTEFLPVSSSGHLVLFYDLFGIKTNTMQLSVILHLATLMAVVIYYRKEILTLIKKPFCATNLKIVTTTLITCLLVLFFKPIINRTFDGQYLFVFFMITAIILYISDNVAEKKQIERRQKNLPITSDIYNMNISYFQAVIIGVSQAFACVPGISRSGSTIATARIMGIDDCATTYSFLLSIPIIIGSLVMEVFSGEMIFENNVFALIVGFVVAFVVGLFAIKLMVALVKQCKLIYFSYYLLVLATILVLKDVLIKLF